MKIQLRHLLLCLLMASSPTLVVAQETTAELDAFIAEETAAEDSDSLLPTERMVDSAFIANMSIVDIPRAVTVLSPEAMEQFQIDDLSDLAKVGAGTQRINYYGIPGTPVLRGAKGGTFFNGMLRAYNRNEMPISFGSLEAMDIIKGPAPAHFTPTHVGGYVNFIPKSPYFDETRGSVMVEIGTYDHFKVQADAGGPILFGDIPTAYRLSITGQLADSYYDSVSNDFISIYGSVKSHLQDDIKLFAGVEYFNFKSNENAGWNRPTQQLIDDGEYVIGEPADMTDPAWQGFANRWLTEFPRNAVLPYLNGLAIPGDIARARIPDSQLALMLDLNTAEGIAEAYSTLTEDELVWQAPGWIGLAQEEIDALPKPFQDAYLYTPAYFEAGGEVLTAPIEGNEVLADESDYADSQDFLVFGDIVFDGNPSRVITIKNLFEFLSTEKLSSYGYAIETEQALLSSKLLVTDTELIPMTTFEYGAGLRYTDAKMLQDFFAEPFGRRDITRDLISPNSVVLTGPQRAPDGLNLWSPSGGANVSSETLQASVFATAVSEWTDNFSTIIAGRLEYSDFDVSLPGEVDRRSPSLEETLASGSGDKSYYAISFSPVFKPMEGLSLYGVAQKSTTMDPTQGGPIFGEDNFAEAELFEAGVKATLLEDKLFFTAAYWQWEQSRFNTRDANSEPLEGEGIDLELTWQVMPNFTVIASFDTLEVKRQTPLGFRSGPLDEEGWALFGGILNGASESVPSNNPDLIYPGFPESTFKLFGVYEFDNGLGISGGPIYQESFWLNFDRTIKLPEAMIWNFNVFYRTETFEVFASVENAFSEDYFYGADPVFAANTLVTKAPPAEYKVQFTYFF